MKFSVELLAAAGRLHLDGDFGDDYVWCCGLRQDPLDRTIAILGPTASAPPKGARPVIAAELRRLGFCRVRWERHKAGKIRRGAALRL